MKRAGDSSVQNIVIQYIFMSRTFAGYCSGGCDSCGDLMGDEGSRLGDKANTPEPRRKIERLPNTGWGTVSTRDPQDRPWTLF